jgi:hypothetical protein
MIVFVSAMLITVETKQYVVWYDSSFWFDVCAKSVFCFATECAVSLFQKVFQNGDLMCQNIICETSTVRLIEIIVNFIKYLLFSPFIRILLGAVFG